MDRATLALVLAVTWCVPSAARAQAALGVATSPGITIQIPDPPAPEPPPASRPDGSPPDARDHHAPPPPGTDLFLAGPETYAPRYDRQRKLFPRFPTILPGYAYVPGPYVTSAPVSVAPREKPRQTRASGALRFLVSPRDAHVFVDGFFVGTAGELRTFPYSLETGPHRIEIVAEGFEPLTFDVRIRARETVTYQKELAPSTRPGLSPGPRSGQAGSSDTPAPPASVAVAANVAAKTLYVIPRCYAGDRQPIASQLPPGCDLDAMRVLSATQDSR